jgi:flagellar hook-basal body complex protein FliE
MKRLIAALALAAALAGEAGAVSYPDGSFEIYDGADFTKRIGIEVSGVTTATKRIYTAPNGSGTWALLERAQTFTVDQRIDAQLSLGNGLLGGFPFSVPLATATGLAWGVIQDEFSTVGLSLEMDAEPNLNASLIFPRVGGTVLSSTNTVTGILNKTFGTTANTLRSSTISSGVAFEDNTNTARKLRFILSTAAAANHAIRINSTATRTYDLPDFSMVVAGSTTALASGRVPFATTSGRLIDDADLTFDTDALTTTKLTVPTLANLGSTAGPSYWKLVGGDDMVCRDDNDWNLLKIRNTTAAGLAWADAESTYQVQLGDVVETDPGPGVRNLMITGSGNTGSVFDRLGIASLGIVLKNALWTGFAAPTSMFDVVNGANSARPLQRWVAHSSQSTDVVQTRNAANDSTRFAVGSAGRVTTYGNVTTAANGLPAAVAQVDLTGQSAAIAASTAYAVPAGGQGVYSIAWVATVTQAATTSSVLGGGTAFQCVFTDPDDSVVKTSSPTTATAYTTAGNTTGDTVSGVVVARCKASTALQYSFGYTSVGGTSMQYNLHVVVTRL